MTSTDAQQRTLDWLANGETGVSSKVLAFAFLGVPRRKWYDNSPPSDPADLRRCLLFLRAVPEARSVLSGEFLQDPERTVPEWAKPRWEALLAHWDELETLLVEEIGPDLDNFGKGGGTAPKTYERMKELERSCDVKDTASAEAGAPAL